MSKKLTVPERVAKGVKWLDKYGPKDWRDKVEIKDLNLQSTCLCVLGQVFNQKAEDEEKYDIYGVSGFDWALEFFRGKKGSIRVVDNPALYGFDAFDDQPGGSFAAERWHAIDKDYEKLRQEWTRVLSA